MRFTIKYGVNSMNLREKIRHSLGVRMSYAFYEKGTLLGLDFKYTMLSGLRTFPLEH